MRRIFSALRNIAALIVVVLLFVVALAIASGDIDKSRASYGQSSVSSSSEDVNSDTEDELVQTKPVAEQPKGKPARKNIPAVDELPEIDLSNIEFTNSGVQVTLEREGETFTSTIGITFNNSKLRHDEEVDQFHVENARVKLAEPYPSWVDASRPVKSFFEETYAACSEVWKLVDELIVIQQVSIASQIGAQPEDVMIIPVGFPFCQSLAAPELSSASTSTS